MGRMRHARSSWARPFIEVARVPCCGTVHVVGVTRGGALALAHHRPDELNALRAVLALGGEVEGCMRLVAALDGRRSWPHGPLAWMVHLADQRREERRPRCCRSRRPPLSTELWQRLLIKAGCAYETGNAAVLAHILRLLADRS